MLFIHHCVDSKHSNACFLIQLSFLFPIPYRSSFPSSSRILASSFASLSSLYSPSRTSSNSFSTFIRGNTSSFHPPCRRAGLTGGRIAQHHVVLVVRINNVVVNLTPSLLEQRSRLNLDVVTAVFDDVVKGTVDTADLISITFSS